MMQHIARAHKGFVSEVVFCTPSDQADYELLYYSSECEVDFCGHGTIACMYSLIASDQSLLDKPTLSIKTKKAVLTVYNELKKQNAVYIAAPRPVYSPLPDIDIAQALGTSSVQITDNYPLGLINAGLNTLIVPIRSLNELIALFPHEQALKEFCLQNGIDIILVFCKETEDQNRFFHTRVFAPKFGYLEDPATGSGNSAFGYYLLLHGGWTGKDIAIEQGSAPKAYNTVRLKCTDDKTVLFGGNAVTRIKGVYFLS